MAENGKKYLKREEPSNYPDSPSPINESLLYYFCCSSLSVIVDWSQTSDGPKYWIGPG